jgi:hypothetical protein
MRMREKKRGRPGRSVLFSVLAAAALSACVTINIYFPAAAAEKMADKIIDDIWQLDAPAGQPSPENPKHDEVKQ